MSTLTAADVGAQSRVFDEGARVFVTLRVLDEVRIRARTHESHFATQHAGQTRKVAYFMLHDGIATTFRKYLSKLMERRIEADQDIVVAACASGAGTLIGITRDLGAALRFEPALLFAAPPGTAAADIQLSPATVQLLEAYLPVPSCPAPDAANAAVLASNPSLRRVERGFLEETSSGTGEPQRTSRARTSRERSVFLIGFGSYAREQIVAPFHGSVAAAVDYRAALIARHASVGFPVYAELEQVLDEIGEAHQPLVIISTYHSDHAPAALAVLDANPGARVFIEKPPAVTEAEGIQLYNRRMNGAWIDIGYNRRHAPLTRALLQHAAELPRPLVCTMLIKELKLPPTHWYFWQNQGTRLTGNLCHWIDLAHALVRQPVEELSVTNSADTVSLALRFQDGSLVTLVASDQGADYRGVTEFIEVRGGRSTLSLDDYHSLEVISPRGRSTIRRLRRNRGHRAMYEDLRARWQSGGAPFYPAEDIVEVTRITARAAAILRDKCASTAA